jgi:hypothetical protein
MKRDSQPARSPRTEVDCLYTTVRTDRGDTLLRLATLGSDHRKLGPKPSQIIEMDQAIAEELVRIVLDVFPDLDVRRAR